MSTALVFDAFESIDENPLSSGEDPVEEEGATAAPSVPIECRMTDRTSKEVFVEMARMIQCIKLGREEEGLDFPPLPGDIGKRVFENVSKPAWQQWLAHQTMLINENRLKVTDPEARRFLEGELEKFFFAGGSKAPSGFVPPSKTD